MKKLYSRKLAVALALASLFGVKPASGLNNFAKLGIPMSWAHSTPFYQLWI